MKTWLILGGVIVVCVMALFCYQELMQDEARSNIQEVNAADVSRQMLRDEARSAAARQAEFDRKIRRQQAQLNLIYADTPREARSAAADLMSIDDR